MKVDRRTFLGGTAGLFGFLGLDLSASTAVAHHARVEHGRITSTVCPFCGVGCGALVSTSGGVVTNIEGDPDHPVNRGALCSKGAALRQIVRNDRRLSRVRYRAPGSDRWEERDWDWALRRIGELVKRTRDASFVARDERGRTVNRTEGLACLGGASLDNEECYAYSKLARALGVVYLEHQARI